MDYVTVSSSIDIYSGMSHVIVTVINKDNYKPPRKRL
jgi:hypothetical protein